jgi:hypothetical protein
VCPELVEGHLAGFDMLSPQCVSSLTSKVGWVMRKLRGSEMSCPSDERL